MADNIWFVRAFLYSSAGLSGAGTSWDRFFRRWQRSRWGRSKYWGWKVGRHGGRPSPSSKLPGYGMLRLSWRARFSGSGGGSC